MISFKKYKKFREIKDKHSLIIFPREIPSIQLTEDVKKYLSFKTTPKNIILIKNKNLTVTNISSSIVRNRVKNNLSIKYLVPEKVEEYILKHKLYT